MAVKELVQQFEASGPQSSRLGQSDQDQPPPRNARFIKHRTVLTSNTPQTVASSQASRTRSRVSSGSSVNGSTAIQTPTFGFDSHEAAAIKASGSQTSSQIIHADKPSLATLVSTENLSDTSSTADLDSQEEPIICSKDHTYPPDVVQTSDTPSTSHPMNSSRRRKRSHKPIPAPVVFSRGAYPLSLPKLDEYLASLPLPLRGSECSSSRGGMFPPMDALTKTGRSLEDLETEEPVLGTCTWACQVKHLR